MKKILALVMTLVSCGSNFTLASQDDDLASYVQRFEDVYGIEISDVISITFADLDSANTNHVGVCTVNDETTKSDYIQIDPNTWATFDDSTKEEVIFHEIGHCILDRNHTTAVRDSVKYGRIPASIMFPSILDTNFYQRFHDYYRNELINNSVYKQEQVCLKDQDRNLTLLKDETNLSRPQQSYWLTRESKTPSKTTKNLNCL